MDSRAIIFLFAVGAFLVALAAITVRSYQRAAKSSERGWEQLVKSLQVVDRSSITAVALDIFDESGQRRKDDGSQTLEPERIWRLIGGLKGLEVLEANCQVLIDLAFYVQRWYPEALVIAEQLRLSAREIEWHVERLESAQRSGKLKSAFAMYAQPAVGAYYVMTRRLLALCEQENLPILADLRKVL